MDPKRPLEDYYDQENKRQRVGYNGYSESGQYQVFPGVYVNLPDNQHHQPGYQPPGYQSPVYQQGLQPQSFMNYQQPQYMYNVGYQQFQPGISMTPQQQLHSQWQPQSYSSYMNPQVNTQYAADTHSGDDNDAPEVSSSKLPPPPLHLKQKFTSLPKVQKSGTSKKQLPDEPKLQGRKEQNIKQSANIVSKVKKGGKTNINKGMTTKKGATDADLAYSDESEDEDGGPDDEKLSKAVIQGTNIVLESEEDVKRWIEERRKNWPTNKRVDEKKQLLEKAQKNMGQIASQAKTNPSKPICRFFQKTGRCKHGASCKFSHQSQQNQLKALPNHKVKVIHGIPVQVPQRFTPLQHKGKSLDSLLFEEEHFKSENLSLLSVFSKLSDGGHLSSWDEVLSKLGLN